MNLSDLIPSIENLQLVQGVEADLLRRQRKGNISGIIALKAKAEALQGDAHNDFSCWPKRVIDGLLEEERGQSSITQEQLREAALMQTAQLFAHLSKISHVQISGVWSALVANIGSRSKSDSGGDCPALFDAVNGFVMV
jgi:hypothetical protein